MTYFDQLTDAILDEIAVRDTALAEARDRRDLVRRAAESFPGANDSYLSGSLAYGTAIRPVSDRDKGVDGDCGIILDRRQWPSLGPDSDDKEGPRDIVEQVKQHLRDKLGETYPNMRITTTDKRAIRITFGAPLDTGEDPPVELIVALTRKGAPGLWIPNLKTNGWDAAHPVKHRKLINTDPPKALRSRRAKIVRLAKQYNKKRSTPAFSSFHLQALALETLGKDETGRKLVTSLHTYFEASADSLEDGMTQDPAGVSGILKLQNGITKDQAVERLRSAADKLHEALDAPNDKELVRDRLSAIFGSDVVDAAHDRVQGAALAEGNTSLTSTPAGIGIGVTDRPSPALTGRSPNAWRTR